MARDLDLNQRQTKFVEKLSAKGISHAIISEPKHVFYLSNFLTHKPKFSSFLLLDCASQNFTLFLGDSEISKTKNAKVSNVLTFQDYEISERMVAYPDFISKGLARVLKETFRRKGKVGFENWHLPFIYASALAEDPTRLTGISEIILDMRKVKQGDEIQKIERTVKRIDSAYKVAKESIKPGASEMDLYSEINKMIFEKYGVFEFGERPNAFGDYVSGERTLAIGGPPTRRKMKRSDSVILDLEAPAEFYWGDTARTFLVGGKPSANQKHVYEAVLRAKSKAETLLRPGTTGAEIWKAIVSSYKESGYRPELPHHAGHGIGLDDQEPPFFLPNSKDKLEEGVVCAIEPGLYQSREGGVRIEDDYVITRDGYRKISHFPVAL